MIKVYDGRTGKCVDSFREPTKEQLRNGHPTHRQMIAALNMRGFCVKSQLKASLAYTKACTEVAALDDAKERWDEMTTAERNKLEEM